VLALFGERIWPAPSRVALELVDAASLIFRLYLRGVEPAVGPRGWPTPGAIRATTATMPSTTPTP
jgi:hypothetical protein